MMSIWKVLICVCLIFLATLCFSLATTYPEGGRMLGGVYVYPDEPQCIQGGGLCVKETDCLELHPKSGLCPLNADKYVECCLRTPSLPAPCHEHLGECMPRCSPIIQRPATDCSANQVCCVLVR